jgi:hypothetical protein
MLDLFKIRFVSYYRKRVYALSKAIPVFEAAGLCENR